MDVYRVVLNHKFEIEGIAAKSNVDNDMQAVTELSGVNKQVFRQESVPMSHHCITCMYHYKL